MDTYKQQTVKTILYIEDDEANYKLVERAFQNYKHYALLASNSAEYQ